MHIDAWLDRLLNRDGTPPHDHLGSSFKPE